MKISIAFTGRSYPTGEGYPDTLDLPDGATLQDAVGMLQKQHELPPSCLVTISGEHAGSVARLKDRPLSDGQELLLIAPVAGG